MPSRATNPASSASTRSEPVRATSSPQPIAQACSVARRKTSLEPSFPALADIYRRPAREINGSKWLWSAAALVNFMGIGPIAYILFGRKRA